MVFFASFGAIKEVFFSVVLSLALVFFVLFFARRRFFFVSLRKSERVRGFLPVSLAELLFPFAFYLFSIVFISNLLFFFMRFFLKQTENTYPFSEYARLLHSLLIQIITGFSFLFVCRRRQRDVFLSFFGNISRRGKLFYALRKIFEGMKSWLFVFPFVLFSKSLTDLIVLILWPYSESVDQTAVHYVKISLSYPLIFAVWTIVLVALTPIIEEVLFRGFLQTYLKRYLSPMGSILLSSLIFSLFHFSSSQGYENIKILTALFVFSCFLAYLYEAHRSLWVSIGLHGCFNGISVFVIYLSHSQVFF